VRSPTARVGGRPRRGDRDYGAVDEHDHARLEGVDPDRWAGRRLRADDELPARELVTTFGHGPHRCPAQRFSLSAIGRAVRRLFAAYELEPGFDSVHPLPRQIGGVARAADPCPVAYRRR
jgi:cytochrome P450